MSLADDLESDLSWRESELVILKRLAVTASGGSVREKALLRAMLALLYAHYEGFCKYAWQLYVDAIESELPTRGALQSPLICLSLEDHFTQLRNNASDNDLLDFHRKVLPKLLNKPVKFSATLEADSNLSPDRYCENMNRACLPYKEIKERRSLLRSLVARRNGIAHGESAFIENVSEYNKYEDAAIIVMHELAISIIDSIDKKLYLSNSNNEKHISDKN